MGASTETESRVQGSKSGRGDEMSVVYSNPGGGTRTCTLHVIAGKDSASVSLRDYTFDKEGTSVDIGVHNGTNTGGGVGTMDYNYSGNALQVCKGASLFSIGYGVRRLRCGFLVASIHKTGTEGDALFVTHVYRTVEKRLSLVVVKVWLDGGEGFMYELTGPTRHSRLYEVHQAMRKAYPPKVAITKYSSLLGAMEGVNKADQPQPPPQPTSEQTTSNTGLINNAGPVHGNLNGSIINIYNFYVNNQAEVK